jgi:hypothetical protein
MKKYIKNNEIIQNVVENVFFTIDESNTDYQAYLAWLAEGNEPETIE